MVGTTHVRVTPVAAASSTNARTYATGSNACTYVTGSSRGLRAGGTITVGTPRSNGPNSSQNESTKFAGVRWQQTSPGSNGYSRHIHASRLSATRCGTSTPFGRPVDPEV